MGESKNPLVCKVCNKVIAGDVNGDTALFQLPTSGSFAVVRFKEIAGFCIPCFHKRVEEKENGKVIKKHQYDGLTHMSSDGEDVLWRRFFKGWMGWRRGRTRDAQKEIELIKAFLLGRKDTSPADQPNVELDKR